MLELELLPIVQRLRDRCAALKDVDLAINRKQGIDSIKRYPSAYLLPGKSRGNAAQQATQTHMQLIEAQFEVLIFIGVAGVNVSSSKRVEHDADPVREIAEAVGSALAGWTWSPYVHPISYVGGDLYDLDANRMILQRTFATRFEYRKTTTD